jgi:hypothetical protein
MEGGYLMRDAKALSGQEGAEEFEARIGRFFLVCPPDGVGDL